MDRTVTYEKVYFNDDYRQQFEAFRDRYRSRTQKAIGNRTVDHHPVSNISEIIHLHDNGDGDVTTVPTVDDATGGCGGCSGTSVTVQLIALFCAAGAAFMIWKK